jgi:hypothetical protein
LPKGRLHSGSPSFLSFPIPDRGKRFFIFLNVNVPAGGFKGVEWTTLSLKPRYDSFERRVSPNGRLYFWPVWKQLEDDSKGTDVWAFVRGFISITPMRLDVIVPEADIEAFRSLDLRGEWNQVRNIQLSADREVRQHSQK